MNQVTKDQVEEIVGHVEAWEDDRDAYRFRPSGSVSFKQLGEISELFGTEAIDLDTGREGYHYSSWTYEDGCAGSIVVYKNRD